MQNTQAQDKVSKASWKKLKTAEDFCKAYPKRAEALFRYLNLDYPGLEKVRGFVKNKKLSQACKALLFYYKNGTSGSWLRKPKPTPGISKNKKADTILKDIYTVQSVTHRQPRFKNGKINWSYLGPNNDREWGWLVNRHSNLNHLAKAYLNTGNKIYIDFLSELIHDWVTSNPYTRKNTYESEWRVLEVGLRLGGSWPRIFYSLQESGGLTPVAQLLMLSSVPEHLDCLHRFHAKKGNHILMEMNGVANACAAWPEFKKTKSYVKYAIQLTSAEMNRQVYPDGVQMELTSHYHTVSFRNFDQFEKAINRVGHKLPKHYGNKLMLMRDYLAYTMRPSGYGILNNDSSMDFNKPRIIKMAKKFKRDNWLYIATNGQEGLKPKKGGTVIYPWAGQLIMRNGYEAMDQWAFFDMGPWGLGHQHNDKLHLSISAFGRDFIVDSGRFPYTGKMAKRFRWNYGNHSSGHNVILVDGQGQDKGVLVAKKPINQDTYKISPAFDYARSSHNRFEKQKGNIKHTRSIFYVKGKFWVVVDKINTDRPRKIQVLWHWHPKCNVVKNDLEVSSIDKGKGNLGIIPLGDVKWNLKIVKGQEKPRMQGWYSEQYNIIEPSPTAVYSASIEKSSTFAWIFYPSKGQVPQVKASIISQNRSQITVSISGEDKVNYQVTVPIADKVKPILKVIK